MNYFVNFVKNNNIRSVLELGCGTGRIGLKLIPYLIHYVGIDLSEEFLLRFKTGVNENDSKVKILNHDMTDFSLHETFDLIILPFSALANIYSFDQMKDMLSCVRTHMREDSLFLIDCLNPDMTFLATHSERVLRHEFVMSETNEKISVYETNIYFSDKQVNYIKRIYVNNSKGTELEFDYPMRMYYPQELNALLQLNGFLIVKKYGDYLESEFDANSQRQNVITKLKPNM